jgi:glycyl-tRNA synthetase beta chain
MTDFLLELRSEEIPARMQEKAREDLARLFAAELDKAGIRAAETVTYATPRRLALIARGLPDQTAAVSEETKGPRTSAPPQALDGFLRKTGLTQDQLTERDGVYYAVVEKPGRATAEVIAEAVPAVIRAFPWPKSMRWGAPSLSTESPRWVRPLQGIVAILGEQVIEFEAAGVRSGAATVGHRFHHPGVITIGGASDYVEKLRACHVIVDGAERRGIIALGAKMAAQKAGLQLVEDEGLLFENAGLTEWPVPLLGRFDEAFLQVPPEVIQLTARVNQKYFVCRDREGRLANAFVCVANVDAADGGERIVEGNQKVLAARLSDARFFYDTDLKVPLEEQAKKLEKIVFHEKLGTVADKVERVAKLARLLVEEAIILPGTGRRTIGEADGGGGAPHAIPLADSPLHRPSDGPPPRAGEDREQLAALAERAARLCKADLVTGMVGEFPELQGVMGGYYAAAQGEDPQVAEAIRDHYKPVGQGDEVPTAPVTVAVSLADKLDSLLTFFSEDMRPSGSKDPFALRRSALAVIMLLLTNRVRLPLRASQLEQTIGWRDPEYGDLFEILGELSADHSDQRYVQREIQSRARRIDAKLLDFFADRLKVQQREAGVRHDLIDAVFALGGEDDLVRLLARVRALQAFVETREGANLLAGYKRAANILKKEGHSPSPLVGEGRGPLASASGKGEGDVTNIPSLTPPHPSASRDEPGTLPPSPTRGEGERTLAHTPLPEEASLIAALDAAEPVAAAAIEREDFEAAMAALASLRAPIDAFFDQVTVNDPDPAKRDARLALLARMRDAVHKVADFSRIEG